MKGRAPRRSATAPISQRDRAAVMPMMNRTSAAVPESVSCGAKVSTAPPAMVTLNSTRVGGTMPLSARNLPGSACPVPAGRA